MPGLLPHQFLFRFSFPVRYAKQLPRAGKKLLGLSAEYALPQTGLLDDQPEIGDLRLAWNENGLAISIEVAGKKRPPQCDPQAPELSDGLQVWVDTRSTQNIHRASRFCHHFCLLPAGGEPRKTQPFACQLPIARAKEPTPLSNPADLRLASQVARNGYLLEAWLPTEALQGYDPAAQPRLGFYCLLRDAELGDRPLTVGAEFPFAYDPSLWSVLELTR